MEFQSYLIQLAATAVYTAKIEPSLQDGTMQAKDLIYSIARSLTKFRATRYEEPAKIIMHPLLYLSIRLDKHSGLFPTVAQLTPHIGPLPDGGMAYGLTIYGIPVETANVNTSYGYQFVARSKPKPETK